MRSWPTGGCFTVEGEGIMKLLYITSTILFTALIRTVVMFQFVITVSLRSPHDMLGQTDGIGRS
jgi:hypothetical protein